MYIIKTKQIIRLAVLLGIIGIAHASLTTAWAKDAESRHTSDLPEGCSQIAVPEGNRLTFRTYAIGVQIYRWNGAAWDFVAPEANLYLSRLLRIKIGTHYAGPVWEGLGGSLVAGRRVQGCDPDPTAISWLLLEGVTSEGPGIFNNVTYIQRVNTRGGLKPVTPGSVVGEEARVPYTTDYYFYKEAN